MNMIVTPASPATPTAPRVRRVRSSSSAMSTTASPPIGRLPTIPVACPMATREAEGRRRARGVPFEWSPLTDALQTECATKTLPSTPRSPLPHQFARHRADRRARPHRIPAQHDHRRSQADARCSLSDALEGVRDQTRRHGYLLQLLGVKQVAVVVNKMDRVDFSASASRVSATRSRASARARCEAHGRIPISRATATASPSPRTGSAGTRARPWSKRSTGSSRRGRAWKRLALRLPVQAIYKFDDRRIVAGRLNWAAWLPATKS